MQKLMMSLPWAASAVTSASTTKAFSVPRDCARLLISGMAFSTLENAYFSRAQSASRLVGPHRPVAAGLQLQAQDRAPERVVGNRMAPVARQRDVGLAALLVVPDMRHQHRRRPLRGGLERL